jgi:fibronectin-binding autotransporter adhesin
MKSKVIKPCLDIGIITSLLAVSPAMLQAADWNGSQSSNWNDPLNWNGDAVPAGQPAAIQSATGNIATISENSTFAPSEVVIGGWWATGRLDHTAGTLNTQNVGWPPGWVLVGFGAQGNATYNLADTSSTGGQFTGFGTGTGSTNLTSDLFIGEPGGGGNGNGIGTTNINTSGNLAVAGQIFAGVSGWTGHLNLDAGTVTASNLNVAATRGTSGNAAIGNFRMSGGEVTLVDRLNIANGASDVPAGNNVGVVTISGGTLRTDNLHNDFWAAGVSMASAAVSGANGGTGGSATLNLDGGVLSTLNVFSSNATDSNAIVHSKGTSTFNFNGGTLRAQATRDLPWFALMSDLTRANVRDGGAVIDSNGFNVLISQPLLHSNIGGDAAIDGGLVKTGAGQLELTGQNTFTGQVVVQGGTLYANMGNAASDRVFSHVSGITLHSGTSLRAASNALFGWDGAQAKPILVNDGASAVALFSDQNVGLVTLAGGTLASENINDSGWGSWNFGRAADRRLLVTADSSVTAVGVGFQNGSVIEVADGATLDFTGTITNKPDGASTLIKEGAGTVSLSGNNTFTGPTVITAGTLAISGAGSVAASSSITVASGATMDITTIDGHSYSIGSTTAQILSGTGTVNSAGKSLVLGNVSTLSPGSSPGTLTIAGALLLSSATTLAWELDGENQTVGAGINDLVTGVTDLTLDGILNVTETVPGSFLGAAPGGFWRLFDYSGTLTDAGLALGTMPALASGYAFAVDTNTYGQVNLLIIPEPSTAAIFSSVLVLCFARRRRASAR